MSVVTIGRSHAAVLPGLLDGRRSSSYAVYLNATVGETGKYVRIVIHQIVDTPSLIPTNVKIGIHPIVNTKCEHPPY